MKHFKMMSLALLAIGAMATNANAHTVTVGAFNAGLPGSVTFVMGSYHTGSPVEGTFQLIAGPSAPTAIIPFATRTAVKPVQLIDGVNNFWASNNGVQGLYNLPSDPGSPPTPTNWQMVTLTGLSAGVYTYKVDGMNSIVWSDWNSSRNNWTGPITITGQQTGEVPEPGTLAIWSILGLGGAFVGFRRRKAAKA